MWYAVCGMWEWTGRDDGGFDCMTEIIAPASNVFGAPLGDPEDKEAFEIPAELRNQIREQRKYLSWRESEVKDVRDDKDLQEGLKELGNFVFEVVKWNFISLLARVLEGEAVEPARGAVVWMHDLRLTKSFKSAYLAPQCFTNTALVGC
jgi:hypothetical protein